MRRKDLEIYVNFPFPQGFPEEWKQPIRNILLAEALRSMACDIDGSFAKNRCLLNKMIDKKTVSIVVGAILLFLAILGFIFSIKVV